MKIKNVFVGLLVVLAFVATWLHGSHSLSPQPKPLGDATVSNYPTAYINGLQLGNNPTVFENMQAMTIGTGQNQASWQNTTGATIWIDTPEMYFLPTTTNASMVASSSVAFYFGTSSTAVIANNFARPAGLLPIDGALIATSTRGQVTVTSTSTTAGIKAVIPVQNGEWVFGLVESNGCTSATAGLCETATSSNRGFNVGIRSHVYQ